MHITQTYMREFLTTYLPWGIYERYACGAKWYVLYNCGKNIAWDSHKHVWKILELQ